MASAVRTHLNRLETLGRAVRDDMLRLLKQRFPSGTTAPVLLPWMRDDVIYVTAEGMAKRQQEIDHHVNVKMRDNARAIGAAAELGDLSENSEYKFALEERDLLQARLAQMNAEMSKAGVMSVDEVPTDQVGIGSRAVFRRASDGHIYEITFVGPWESDGARSMINYLAPIAKKVLGKRIGETVEFDHAGMSGTYEIVEIHNGLV
jgi:transcription elongation factor GreA